MKAYKQLTDFVESCSMFFNERISDALKRLTGNAIDEAVQNERNKNISKELQELEPMLIEYRENKRNHEAFQEIQMDRIIKKIKELYKHQ